MAASETHERSWSASLQYAARRAAGGPPNAEPAADAGPAAPQAPRLTAAKAYRFLRAVLMTAVEEDKILARNPCRVRGAGGEDASERPVLTVAQVFELAEWVGRHPVGSIRKLPDGSYRLRFARHGERRTSPEVYLSRADADRALWKMMADGRADFVHDRRYRALILLATFASLRGVRRPR